MKYVYASRTGNVASIIQRLGLDALYLETGRETIREPFILFTYTDGYGDVPQEVEAFLSSAGSWIKGVIVSGDTGYGEAYCAAGDRIARDWNIPCLCKVENEGTEEDLERIRQSVRSVLAYAGTDL